MSSSITQYGFYYDQGRCVGCQACAVGCKGWNGIAAGPQKPLRIFKWEEGTWTGVSTHILFAPCYHCQNPVCVTAATDGSLIKEPEYGAVLIDPAKATSPYLERTRTLVLTAPSLSIQMHQCDCVQVQPLRR